MNARAPALKPQAPDAAAPTRRPSKALRAIAGFKFLEAAVVGSAGLGSRKLLEPATVDALTRWIQTFSGATAQRFGQKVIAQLSGMSPQRIEELGIGALLFAGIFLIEGTGLWLEKRWAEWLAVVATALFMPLEILEIYRHVSPAKLTALVLNALLVGYLIRRILVERPGSRAAER